MNLEGKLFIREELIKNKSAKDYVLKTVLTDIDKDSEFEKRNLKAIKSSSNNPTEYIKQLAQQGYDVLIGYDGEEIIGHMAFQEHHEESGNNWQMFRIHIIPEKRLKGYPIPLSEEFLKKASKYGATKVRLGGGRNPIMKKILERIKMQNYIEEIDFDSLWITLKQPQNPP